MSEDLEKRVQNAANGITPQTRPDERRRYMGSLRERVLVRMNIKEAQDTNLCSLFLKHFNDYKNYSILLNANTPNSDFIYKIEAMASKKNIPFTLVNDETARTGDEDSAILVVSKTAINKPRVEITQVYPPNIPTEQLPKPKKQKGFLYNLFHGKK